MADAGRILIIPRGDYDANSTYDKLDLVKYKGTSWLAKKNATGVEPVEGEYWQNMFDLNVADNLTTTEEGFLLDARQGKALNDKIDSQAQTLDNKITEVNKGFEIKRQQLLTATYLNDNVAERSGNIVHVSCFIDSLSNGMVAFNLQEDLRPRLIRQISCAGIAKYSEWYLPVLALIGPNGDVTIYFIVDAPHTDIRLDFTYFIC